MPRSNWPKFMFSLPCSNWKVPNEGTDIPITKRGMDRIVNKIADTFAGIMDGNCLFASAGTANEEKVGVSAKLIGTQRRPTRLITIPASHKFLYPQVICLARARTFPKSNFIVTPLCFPVPGKRLQFGSQHSALLPFNRRGRFARNIIHDAVDPVYFIHDTIRHFRQQVMRQALPVR